MIPAGARATRSVRHGGEVEGVHRAGPEGQARPPVKERLLNVATRLFARHGFEGTSVQDIVDAAGVTKGAMYHYYGSKDDLLYEVYHQVLTMQTSHLDEIAAGPGTRRGAAPGGSRGRGRDQPGQPG